MSGIAALVELGGSRVDRARVEGMAASMKHRGPDGIDVWADDAAALAHCMLRTTPESDVERQPLSDAAAGLTLVMDGRIDNWEVLREALLREGAALRDRSDAELVLRAYQRWGEECPSRIEGDFAFLVWDAPRRRMFGARDRMGARPFYYAYTGGALVVASELHAVLAGASMTAVVNEGVLAELLAGEWKSLDQTLWQGVLRLPRAHCLVADAQGPRARCYWHPATDRTLIYRREEEYFAHYRDWLAERIRRLSRSHRPLAFDVSGGLDSSSAFCTAERLRREGRLLAPGMHGYTTVFPSGSESDELRHARAVAEFTGQRIREVPRSRPGLEWFAERARRHRDFPGFPNASAFNGMREQMSAEGCRAVITGESGDTWLDGSRLYYAEELARGDWRSLLECARADVAAHGAAKTARWLLRYGIFELLPPRVQAATRGLMRKPLAQPRDLFWLAPRMRAIARARAATASRTATRLAHLGQRDTLDRLDDAMNAQVAERVELDAAECGLELRHPFDDPAFIEMMLALPERFRLRGDTNKYVHVKALEGWMPDSVLQRRDKADFTQSFVDGVLEISGELRGGILQRRPDWLVREGVERLLEGLQKEGRKAWPMWVLWSAFGCDLALPQAERPGERVIA